MGGVQQPIGGPSSPGIPQAAMNILIDARQKLLALDIPCSLMGSNSLSEAPMVLELVVAPTYADLHLTMDAWLVTSAYLESDIGRAALLLHQARNDSFKSRSST